MDDNKAMEHAIEQTSRDLMIDAVRHTGGDAAVATASLAVAAARAAAFGGLPLEVLLAVVTEHYNKTSDLDETLPEVKPKPDTKPLN